MTTRRDALDDIDVVRLIFLTSFMRRAEGVRPQRIYTPLNLSAASFDNLLRSPKFSNPSEYEGLYFWLFEYLKNNIDVVKSHLDLLPQLSKLFDGRFGCIFEPPFDKAASERVKLHRRVAGYFLGKAESDPPQRERSLENYVGNYQVIRYATSSEQHTEPRIIVAAATISAVEPPKVFPSFELVFPQRHKMPVEDLPRTRGVLAKVDNHVFMVGQDKESNYPTIVVFPHYSNKVHATNGLVLRRHVEGHVIASRCHFIRHDAANGGKTMAQLLSEIDIYDEQAPFVSDAFGDDLRKILNKVPLVGKGTLRLVP